MNAGIVDRPTTIRPSIRIKRKVMVESVLDEVERVAKQGSAIQIKSTIMLSLITELRAARRLLAEAKPILQLYIDDAQYPEEVAKARALLTKLKETT